MNQTPIAVGIDLGTSTSEIAVYHNDAPRLIHDPSWKGPVIPSMVALTPAGELRVGEDARSYVDLPGHGIREVKRLMGTGESVRLLQREFRPEEISAIILRRLREMAEEAMGRTIDEVVLSVPANFADAARQATKTAAELAGLNVIRLINEPTAAALAFGIEHLDAEEQMVVFDFGGGTLDISVCEMMDGVLDVICSFGDPRLGGKDIDELLVRRFRESFLAAHPNATISTRQELELKSRAERCKRALSTQTRFADVVPFFAMENGRPVDLHLELSRSELEFLMTPLLDRVRRCIRTTLQAKDLLPSCITRVLLIGGTTYIPAVRRVVADMFGRQPETGVDPDLAVAMGACISAAQAKGLIRFEDGLILTDVSPYGLGIDPLTFVGGQIMPVYEALIQPNQHIPYSCTKTYHLLHTEQKAVEIRLYQDHTGKAKVPADAVDTGITARITDIPPSTTDTPHPIDVEFSYDINGLVTLRAHIAATGQEVVVHYEGGSSRMDEQEKLAAQLRLEDLWRSSDRAAEFEAIIARAERMIEAAPEEMRNSLARATSDLKDALARNDDEATVQTLADRLVDLLFDLGELSGHV